MSREVEEEDAARWATGVVLTKEEEVGVKAAMVVARVERVTSVNFMVTVGIGEEVKDDGMEREFGLGYLAPGSENCDLDGAKIDQDPGSLGRK